MKYLYLTILVHFLSLNAYSQDIHWSQFNYNPIFQNPGNAGHFNGDYRFVGNYRDQWRSVTVPFSTVALSVDSKLYNHQNFGYAMNVFHDVVGDGSFRTIEFQGSASYLFKITADSTHSVRPGVNIGMNHRRLNSNQFIFDNQFNGIQFDPSIPSNEQFQTEKRTNFSVGLGAIYEYYKNDRFKFTGGFGIYNLNRPNQGFFNTVIKRDMRINVFGKGLYKLNYDWDLVPGVNLSIQGKYREIVLGSSVKYTLVDKMGQYRALYAGLWYRNSDAAYISAGMDYQSWFFGISYDINFSKLVPASNARGGLEISVIYILNRFKPKKIVHRVCPDYI